MFCPLCKAEYRDGFYRCADCDVELVSALPEETRQQSEREDPEVAAWSLLTREDDPVFLTALVSALDEAKIPHLELAKKDFEAFFSSSFPSRMSLARGYEVRVPPAELETAAGVLAALEQKLLDGAAGPAPSQGAIDDQSDAAREIPGDWEPERATSEVWAGKDSDLATFLADTLRENGIGSITASASNLRLLVRPEDAERAREITREVLEGAPPP